MTYFQVGITDECQDVNECGLDGDLCRDGICINTEGSYTCECGSGFEISYDGKSCIGKARLLELPSHLTWSSNQLSNLNTVTNH